MDAHSVTVAMPATLYDHLKRRADQAHRSVEDEIVLALAETVPDDVGLPAELTEVLASMAVLDDRTLWTLARGKVPVADAERLAELADKRQRLGLSEAEAREAAALLDLHDRVMLVRAEAAALLHQRGHDVSVLVQGA